MTILKVPKSSSIFCCKLCDYITSRKSQYERHLMTSKHSRKVHILQNTIILVPKVPEFVCNICNKMYKHNSSLFNHKKQCKQSDVSTFEVLPNAEMQKLTTLVLEVVKHNNELQMQNQELTKQMIEFSKNGTYNTTNSHNKTFNMQIFLNEECKDAMNMSDFINSIQPKLSDLENVGKLGYVEGISNIIIKQLNNTDMYKRPIHCSDIKRETLYIKEEDKWEKENTENTKMKKVINTVGSKNIGMISTWTDKHPNYKESTSHDNDTYLNLVMESMSGDEEHVTKVIKKISKEVAIK